MGDGNLPLTTGSISLFYNGEVYGLDGRHDNQQYDGDLLRYQLAEYWNDGVDGVDGEFAFAAYDAARDELLLGRDRFGTRPLYFAIKDGSLVYASHSDAIRALLQADQVRTVRAPTYQHTLCPQEPYTSYDGIYSVPPGHTLRATRTYVELAPFHIWSEHDRLPDELGYEAVSQALEETLTSRMNVAETVAIPLSAGVDSGIIAFTADRLGIPYQLFSVTTMFGQPTAETEFIERRIERLTRAQNVTRLDCDWPEVEEACATIYADGYYGSARLDTSVVPTHCVVAAAHAAGCRIILDGAGGDELFHGYRFRDDFCPIDGWPRPWTETPFYYSLFTTLPDYVAKVEQAGGYFGMESRYPLLSRRLVQAAQACRPDTSLKWPLRKFLVDQRNYGAAMAPDIVGKFGFSLLNAPKSEVIRRLSAAWDCERRPQRRIPKATQFPFTIGARSRLSVGGPSAPGVEAAVMTE